jgi:hypothetical protein
MCVWVEGGGKGADGIYGLCLYFLDVCSVLAQIIHTCILDFLFLLVLILSDVIVGAVSNSVSWCLLGQTGF